MLNKIINCLDAKQKNLMGIVYAGISEALSF